MGGIAIAAVDFFESTAPPLASAMGRDDIVAGADADSDSRAVSEGIGPSSSGIVGLLRADSDR